jgi:hypothetical protein
MHSLTLYSAQSASVTIEGRRRRSGTLHANDTLANTG